MQRVCISESGKHWFRLWLVAYSAPSHYLNQCCIIVNWNLRDKFQWKFNQYSKFFIRENAFENVVCEMAAILSRERWLKVVTVAVSVGFGCVIGWSKYRLETPHLPWIMDKLVCIIGSWFPTIFQNLRTASLLIPGSRPAVQGVCERG